jgi:hypothetical protein
MRPHPAQAAVASAMLLSLGCRASFIHTAQMTIFSAAAQEKYIPGSAEPARNRSVILEFKVADVDADYRRLQPLVKTWVKPPTTPPWVHGPCTFATRMETSWTFARRFGRRSRGSAGNREVRSDHA